MVALTHNIKLAIYKDIHTERANTCVFEIEISLLFFSLLFFAFLFSTIPRKLGLGIYIAGFVCLRWWFDGYLKSGEKVD